MPKRASLPCRKLGCNAYAEKNGFCELHKELSTGWARTEKEQGNRHARGYGTQWNKLRAVILRRDSHLCQEHLRKGEYVEGNQVDHITPKSLGGTDEEKNLQVLCVDCHKAKTERER
jgi:5-methylcytosine-specific restriction protein A